MTIRRLVFWIHLAAGCIAGLVILTVATSGILLSFRPQIIRWADREFHSRIISENRVHLPVETLVAAAMNGHSGMAVTAITMRSDAQAPAEITLGRDRVFMVDVYSGQLLGESPRTVRSFFQFVEGLHRWMATNNNNRDAGKAITGASSLIFLA